MITTELSTITTTTSSTTTSTEPLIRQEQLNECVSASATTTRNEMESKKAATISTRGWGLWTSESHKDQFMLCSFLKYFILAICGSVLFTCVVFGFFLLSITEIIISAIYSNKCPIQPRIEDFLLVLGIGSMASLLILSILTKFLLYQRRRLSKILINLFAVINAFLLFWVIVGSIWTLTVYERVDYNVPVESEIYCDRNLYQFTLIIMAINYIVILVTTLATYFAKQYIEEWIIKNLKTEAHHLFQMYKFLM